LRRIRRQAGEAVLVPDDPFLLDVSEQVRAYLARSLRHFDVALDLAGHNPFERGVWQAVSAIPYGETRTYAWVAARVGAGVGAAQAVGAAVGANPVPLVVPCHRVIGSDGSLHGFAGGLHMKARLLAAESRQLSLW
jgi:methylated-DNA-[protein]-cysteine S-methyltransferase